MNGFSLYLAPLHSVTDSFFRRTYYSFFRKRIPGIEPFDRCFAPFVTASEAETGSASELLPENNPADTGPIPQILGNDPRLILRTALNLNRLGYRRFNLNLGCPARKALSRMRGVRLMAEPDRLAGLLAETLLPAAESGLTFSLKLRAGMYDKRELLSLLPQLSGLPVEEIIIHPRLGTAGYGGGCDHALFAEAAKLTRHPLAYNGDITAENFTGIRERFPFCNRFMTGRGVLADPQLPYALRGIEPVKRTEILRAWLLHFIERAESEIPGEQRALARIKGYLRYFSGGRYLNRIKTCATTADILKGIFAETEPPCIESADPVTRP